MTGLANLAEIFLLLMILILTTTATSSVLVIILKQMEITMITNKRLIVSIQLIKSTI